MGGNVEGLYYAFGETDLYIICDLPDDATATAVSLNIANAGALNIKVTVLVTPETVDEAGEEGRCRTGCPERAPLAAASRLAATASA